MVSYCDKCNANLGRSNPGVTCVGTCKKNYHFNCIDLTKVEKAALQTSNNLNWVCSSCKSSSAPAISTEPTLSDIMQAINELKSSIEFCSNKIDDFEKKLNVYSEKIKLIEPIKEKCDAMQIKVEDYEQRSRLNNIEIVGIPEKQNENLLQMVTVQLSKTIQCPIAEQDIDSIHRVASYGHSNNKPKNVIVRFVSKLKKDKILACARKFKNLAANNLNFSETNSVYINDHLSPTNKLLLRKVREAANENNFKYVWVRQCRIFVRKNDNSPIIIINSERDVIKIK